MNKKHGHWKRTKLLAEMDGKLDGRFAFVKALNLWKASVADAIGELTPQKEQVLNSIAKRKYLSEQIWSYILDPKGMGNPVNRRSKRLHPIVMEVVRIDESVEASLKLLGLERKAREVGFVDLVGEKIEEGKGGPE